MSSVHLSTGRMGDELATSEAGGYMLPVPILLICEQGEIVRRVEAKFALCDALESEITAAESNAHTLSAAIL